MKLSEKILEWIYLISTNDKYSEWDYRKSFNRVNKPQDQLYGHHNLSTTGLIGPDSDVDGIDTAGTDPSTFNSLSGVHEMRLAWRHIKNWLDKYNPDLASTLLSKCTENDLRDFQKDLNIKLPVCVLEFFKLTDGQGNFGNDVGINGLVFGLKLMPLDEILILTEHWRKVADVLNQQHSKNTVELPRLESTHNNPNQIKKSNISPFSPASPMLGTSGATTSTLKLSSQSSIPPNEVLTTYAHPMWIPIVTDEVGNCIGIDLSPPPGGTWGQVILFGRDFDVKYKIAENFGDFLLLFANDLEMGNWELKTSKKNGDGDLFIGNEGQLVFVDKESGLEIPYLQVLKQRSIQNWITGLEKENAEISAENKKLLAEITSRDKTFLTYKHQSIDKFINSNLADIITLDPLETSNSTNSSTSSLPSVIPSSSTLPTKVDSGSTSKADSPLTQHTENTEGLHEIDI